MTIIDAHLHVWDTTRATYPWLGPDLAPIDRTIAFGEIEASLRSRGVDRVILVQAADDAGDTANMLETADRHPQVAGVVGWVPLDDPERAASELDRLRQDPRVVGIRALIHDRADPGWILRPDVDAGLGAVESAGLPYDYVTSGPAALAHVPVIAERHPALAIVLDHLGKPPMDGDRDAFEGWRSLLAVCAGIPHLTAKVSGLYGPLPAVRAAVDVALDLFGPERLMYGSDWPISELAGGPDAAWDSITAALADLGPDDRDAVFGATATRVYSLASPMPTTEESP